ncbi:MAG TPA: SPOR domain-containing protein [Macromonas sp.]|nr:SPOR domain-containing protein [Macromonas sp.]
MNKQHGGTLLGLIVGLVVGLAAALIVAVYVNKVPIPLMDRGVNRDRDNEAIESERNKSWNPNASLTSKPAPAAPAPSAETPAPAESAPAEPSPPAATVTKDPLGDLIQSQAQAPSRVAAVEAPAQPDPFLYFVQVGAFRNADEAEAQRARLAMLGFDAKVSEREQAGRPVFRVRVGPYDKQPEAESIQNRLTGQNIETALVRVQR